MKKNPMKKMQKVKKEKKKKEYIKESLKSK